MTLGLLWQQYSDELKYSIRKIEPSQDADKRVILSIVFQIFDPLGLPGPVIIQAKMLLQTLWKHKLTWDESLPFLLHTLWVQFQSQLPLLANTAIPRQVTCVNPVSVELLGFADASEKGYGTCIYFRSVDSSNNVHVRLVCAKSKVAPIKTISIPRLELCAAVRLTKLTADVVSAFSIQLTNVFYWTDSTITLAWIGKPPNILKTFVANRVSAIQRNSLGDWNHVVSDSNPADLLSRGTNAEDLGNAGL